MWTRISPEVPFSATAIAATMRSESNCENQRPAMAHQLPEAPPPPKDPPPPEKPPPENPPPPPPPKNPPDEPPPQPPPPIHQPPPPWLRNRLRRRIAGRTKKIPRKIASVTHDESWSPPPRRRRPSSTVRPVPLYSPLTAAIIAVAPAVMPAP